MPAIFNFLCDLIGLVFGCSNEVCGLWSVEGTLVIDVFEQCVNWVRYFNSKGQTEVRLFVRLPFFVEGLDYFYAVWIFF